jgi:hypothetical protein
LIANPIRIDLKPLRRRFMKISKLCILAFFTACLAACGSKSGTIGTLIETKVKSTAPTLTATTSAVFIGQRLAPQSTMFLGDTWNWGSGNYEVFNLLREYNFPADENKIDMTNMYKALNEVKMKLDNYESTCENNRFPAAKTIAAPYTSFGTNYEYTCGFNEGKMSDSYPFGIAMNTTGGVTNVVTGFQWGGNQGGGSIGVMQAKYDSNSQNLIYDMVNCVNCGGSSENFTVRTYIEGNPETHSFTIRTVSRGASNAKAIVGKGVSKGTGSYMLLKYRDESGTKYYCIPSNATETDFQNATGENAAPSNCADLATDVDALTFFELTDAPFAVSDFTNSSILLSL